MLTYEDGAKIPVYGYRNGRKVMLRRAISGKTPKELYDEGLTESFSRQADGTWLLTSYDEATD